MSLLDNVRQTLTDVAGSVVEQSRQIGNQAQLQLQIKKLQVERAKRIHELGKQTFSWYQNGGLAVSGPVPPGVFDVCRQLEDVERQLAAAEREFEEARLQAQQAQAQGQAPPLSPHPGAPAAAPGTSTPPAAAAPPVSAPGVFVPPASPPSTQYNTSVLPPDNPPSP